MSELVSAICKDAGYQSVALQIEIFARLGIMVLCIPILMTLLEVVRGFLGIERMLIRKISDVEKFTKKFPEIYVSEICGIRDAFFVLLYGVTYWEKCLCITAQSGINDETARTSSVVWQFADQYDYGEIDETLKELFPKERLDFKEILIGVLSGDITFSAQLLKQLVKEQFSYAFASSRQNLIHILMLAIMTAVFTIFARAFGNGQAADTGFYVMYLMIVALCLNSARSSWTGWRQESAI